MAHTRGIPPRILSLIAQMRENGEHDEADDIESRYEQPHAGAGTGSPAEEADAAVKVIQAEADAAEQIIDATADAQIKVNDEAAEAQAVVIEAEAEAEAEANGDDLGGEGPESDHWYFKHAKKSK